MYKVLFERRFGQYYSKHRAQWEAIGDQERMVISNGVRMRSVAEGMPVESVMMTDWLAHVSAIEGSAD